MSLTLNNITFNLEHISNVGYTRINQEIEIPLGRSQYFTRGVKTPILLLTCDVQETTTQATINKIKQIREITENINYPFFYLQFPAAENHNDGFYIVDDYDLPEQVGSASGIYEFTLAVHRIGMLGSHRLATYWTAAAEVFTGWATLTSKRLISIPNNAGTTGDAQLENRFTSDSGSIPTLEDPSHATLLYVSSPTVSDWYVSECMVFDSVTAGNTNEATWVRVYSPSHTFSGDTIIQNGLLRLKSLTTQVENWYIWDSVSGSPAWKLAGQFQINGNALPQHVEITSVSSEEIQWREVYQPNVAMTNVVTAVCSLRRGSYFCKYVLTAQNATAISVSGITLTKVNGYAQLFNASANGAGGGGNLATDASNNYQCAYNTTDNIVIAFVLLNQPTFQPTDGGVSQFNESNSWVAGQTRTFFVAGWAQITNPFVLATGRTNAAKLARECMYAVSQQLALVPVGYFS